MKATSENAVVIYEQLKNVNNNTNNNDYNFIEEIIDKKVNGFLKDKAFHNSDNDIFMDYLTNEISGEIISKADDNFKILVNVVLFQDSSLDLNLHVGGIVNPITDGIINKSFSFEKIGCIVTVVCLAL